LNFVIIFGVIGMIIFMIGKATKKIWVKRTII
jgi:hypothetical protein